MEYIPGQIHESLQKEHFFLINHDFCWINCGSKRYSEMNVSSDWDETESIDLKSGDVIVVRYFKGSPTLNAYAYLERVIYSSGDVVEYKKESIISFGLIAANEYLFTDVTKVFMREERINFILDHETS